MSTKKLIKDLLEKLKFTEDPVEREDLEDQILRLAEQDEMIENMTRLDPIPPANMKSTPGFANPAPESNPGLVDPSDQVRLERQKQAQAKEEQYRFASKLESKDEELLRTEMLNRALASNDEYAFRKEHRAPGAKNKNKKKHHK